MLLDGKNAIIYGGGGSIGGAVARAFAREGAKVHLAGRTPEKLEAVADEIRANGAQVETAQVDALDPDQVDAHVDAVAAKDGRLDVSFCLISQGDVQGTPLNEMSVDDFMQPVVQTVRATFVTSRAAARHMIRQRSGVILAFGGYGPPMAKLGGLQVAFGAVESLRRSLCARARSVRDPGAHAPDRRRPRVDSRGARVASDDHRAGRPANDARARRVAGRRRERGRACGE